LANTKSAIKRIRQNEKRRLRNRMVKSKTRTYIKKAIKVIESKDLEAAKAAALTAIKALDKAAEKGVLHKNNAARRKSRLMRRLARAQKGLS
jgi:small subunit ribosomal protein S20